MMFLKYTNPYLNCVTRSTVQKKTYIVVSSHYNAVRILIYQRQPSAYWFRFSSGFRTIAKYIQEIMQLFDIEMDEFK